jgi:hypothetical protein
MLFMTQISVLYKREKIELPLSVQCTLYMRARWEITFVVLAGCINLIN